jgi:hypothetical protein
LKMTLIRGALAMEPNMSLQGGPAITKMRFIQISP